MTMEQTLWTQMTSPSGVLSPPTGPRCWDEQCWPGMRHYHHGALGAESGVSTELLTIGHLDHFIPLPPKRVTRGCHGRNVYSNTQQVVPRWAVQLVHYLRKNRTNTYEHLMIFYWFPSKANQGHIAVRVSLILLSSGSILKINHNQTAGSNWCDMSQPWSHIKLWLSPKLSDVCLNMIYI